MKTSGLIFIYLSLIVLAVCASADERPRRSSAAIPPNIHARIIQLEDERNLNGDELMGLLKHQTPEVRERAALAIGRIGDKQGTEPLINALQKDESVQVRAMAAFALGEIEDAQAANALLDAVNSSRESLDVRARAVEALGKIAGIQSNAERLGQLTLDSINQSLVNQLPAADAKLSEDQKLLSSLTVAALMRLRNPASVEPLTRQLKSNDAGVRAQAANALARLRQPINSAIPALIEALKDSDAVVRANAARALGASKDARAVEPLIKLLNDKSEQAQANAIRALAAIGDKRAVEPLLNLGNNLHGERAAYSAVINPMLEISTAFGMLKDERAMPFLRRLRDETGLGAHPEIEIAVASFGEREFFTAFEMERFSSIHELQRQANVARGMAETESKAAKELLLWYLGVGYSEVRPVMLRALSKLKPDILPIILREELRSSDVFVRATAAALLSNFIEEKNLDALVESLSFGEPAGANDAKLAILTALSKYKSEKAIEAIKTSLSDRDHLVRRHAVDLLKQMGAGDFSGRIGVVQTGHDKLFYRRVAARLNKKVTATIYTGKGQIKIELFPQDAPITVDSFITLARKGFFNNQTFHRVVPNFVIQGGDPRGDGEGGPGYQIHCEINTRPYTRGAVGMALSGKDTGGSQFFITHSPQPHLDGGYTVFGQVTSGMDVVDRIARGDLIRKVEIFESR